MSVSVAATVSVTVSVTVRVDLLLYKIDVQDITQCAISYSSFS